MSVSVAMATYMGARYVLDQLQSVVEQSTPPAEIVVCDDGSSDGTAEIVAAFARTSPVPVTLVRNPERLGWRANALKAASLCRSDVIAFCDQDDLWHPRKLELIAAAFADADTLVVFHDATIVTADLVPIGPFLQGDGEPARARAMERGPWRDVYGFTIAFRRDLLELWEYWPSSVDKSVGHHRAAHDQWLLFLGNALGTTRHLPTPLALYRQHGGNAVGAKNDRPQTTESLLGLDHRQLIELRLRVLSSRIQVLDRIARDHPRFGAAATAAATTHVAYRRLLAAQATIHGSPNLPRRLRSLAGLCGRGAYSDGPWALSRADLVRDCAAAVLGPARFDRAQRTWRRRRAPRRSGSPA